MFRVGDLITCHQFHGYGKVTGITAEGLIEVTQVMASTGKPYRHVPFFNSLHPRSVTLITRESIEKKRTEEIAAINKKYNAVAALITRE